MGRKRSQKSNATAVLFLLVLLVIGGCIAYHEARQAREGPSATAPQDQSPDLVSDNRLIYGGAPRPRPGSEAELQFEVLKNEGYIAGYSESRRDPLWVSYRVFHPATLSHLERPSSFSTDTRTTARVKDSDFTRSGYDRGHMAPNEAIMEEYGFQGQMETFLLSNICPQAPELNRHVWERLEAQERKYAAECEEIWVIDGPIFADLNGGTTQRLAAGVAVPSAFYKIIVDEQDRPGGKPRAFAVIMPQDVKGTELPQQFLTTIAEIEKESHLEFFWKLDAATRAELESRRGEMW
ncbi:MAG TPA: DNA/RNA non-specific endonuclease [Phycisphaerae bacterium]|nr:DNA/RNA non-specific endonuclease [Phycisphaerae bacterium]